MQVQGIVHLNGRLSDTAVVLLHAVTGVDENLLRHARIRPAASNWLHAPWYPYSRGGALTLGRTIWFTRAWYRPDGLGDGSLHATYRWLLHLAHEAGHLPQAHRFGLSLPGKARYVAAFAWQYGSRALLFRRPVHDGSPLEREADIGRQVLLRMLQPLGERHPLVEAALHGDLAAVQAWCRAEGQQLLALLAEGRMALSA